MLRPIGDAKGTHALDRSEYIGDTFPMLPVIFCSLFLKFASEYSVLMRSFVNSTQKLERVTAINVYQPLASWATHP